MTDTSTDLVVIPSTGEALSLTQPTDDLAAAVDFCRDLKRQADTAIRTIGEELLRRQDKAASWTTHTEHFEIVGQSPAPDTEWDVDALRATLTDMVEAEEIADEAFDNALEPVVTWKVRKRGLDAIRKLNDDVRERIDACGRAVERQRRVAVKLKRAA